MEWPSPPATSGALPWLPHQLPVCRVGEGSRCGVAAVVRGGHARQGGRQEPAGKGLPHSRGGIAATAWAVTSHPNGVSAASRGRRRPSRGHVAVQPCCDPVFLGSCSELAP